MLFSAIARADPSPRTFVGDFIGNDATADNALSVSGSVDRGQNSESVYLEKAISPVSSFSVFAGYQRFEQEEEDTTSSNLELAYKRILIALPRREFVFSINPSIELPLGNRSAGNETHARAGIDLLFQKGFAELPDAVRVLRPFGVEGDFGWQSKVTGARDDLITPTSNSNIRCNTSTKTSPPIRSRAHFASSRRISISTTGNISALIATRRRRISHSLPPLPGSTRRTK